MRFLIGLVLGLVAGYSVAGTLSRRLDKPEERAAQLPTADNPAQTPS
jgi:hypothetical protein